MNILSEKDVMDIFDMFHNQKQTAYRIAMKYSYDRTSLVQILKRLKWKNVDTSMFPDYVGHASGAVMQNGLTDDELKVICDDYQNLSRVELAKKYDLTETQIKSIIRKFKLKKT